MAAIPASPSFLRHLQALIEDAFADTPAVLINGPRQSGKTNLARLFEGAMPYVSPDDATLLAAARSHPQGFVHQHDRAIFDEIQRAPELLLALKLAIDNDRRPGRFLLTGSANVMSLSTVAVTVNPPAYFPPTPRAPTIAASRPTRWGASDDEGRNPEGEVGAA